MSNVPGWTSISKKKCLNCFTKKIVGCAKWRFLLKISNVSGLVENMLKIFFTKKIVGCVKWRCL